MYIALALFLLTYLSTELVLYFVVCNVALARTLENHKCICPSQEITYPQFWTESYFSDYM